ncbi:hypothetical protein C8Q75DRAFT_888257 [Abortiporus biennis]|nr:hypothetical protein C8Q75DRAFT_888257 [Abortiporus biennis]
MSRPSTPPPIMRTTEDTPPKQKFTSGTLYNTKSLETNRTAVVKDIGDWVPTISPQTFLDKLLPDHSDINLVNTKAYLIHRNVITNNRWKAFSEDNPADATTNENTTFAKLQTVIGEVISAAGQHCDRSSNFYYGTGPNTAPESTTEYPNLTRPDGYFLPTNVQQNPTVSWYDIAVSAEFKKANKRDALEDSMHHVLRSDPSRRFTYGFTIEDTDMRLWFCSRSAVIASTPFDFITDQNTFIRAMTAFAFASKEELGWDHSVELHRPVSEPPYYTFEVHEWKDGKVIKTHKYRTVEPLSTFSADAIIGRATRVYKAVLIDPVTGKPGTQTVALKDYWLDEDRATENEIQQAIYEDARGNQRQTAILQKHLLTIVREGAVPTVDGNVDNTKTIMRDLDLRREEFHKLLLKDYSDQIRQIRHGSGHHFAPSSGRNELPYIFSAPKKHIRLVYFEVGIALHSIDRPHTFFSTIRDIVIALEVLTELGWVHRDVSPGNGLNCDGVGKLSDLEYAKKMSVDGSHELRTGTQAFMAYEVAQGRYIAEAEGDEHPPMTLSTSTSRPDFPTFFYNPLHDLESIWWICLWGVCLHYVQEDPVQERLRAQLREAINLFAVTSLHARHTMLVSKIRFQSEFRVHLDREFPEIADFLENTRRHLYWRYRHIIDSTTEQIDVKMFNGIHGQILNFLKPCLEVTQKLGNKWHLYDSSLARSKEGERNNFKYKGEDKDKD